MTTAVAALALLTVAVVAFVALPLVRREASGPPGAPVDAELVMLLERRDAAFASIRDLELDHASGRLVDADFAAELATLRAEAVDLLAQIETRAESIIYTP